MKRCSLIFLTFMAMGLAAPPTYKVVDRIKIGGANRWDYAYMDSAAHRLYVSHAVQVEVIDTATDKLVGTITGTNGVHGIAVAADLGRGFISDGADNDVTIFDLKTLAVISKVKSGQNPDAIIYEPLSKRVYTFNGRSKDATAIDAKTGDVIAMSIPLGGKPEFAQVNGKGQIFVNNEDTSEVMQIDAKDALVAGRYSIAPCVNPSGLAIDPKGRLYSVCSNKMMVISDPVSRKVLGTAEIGLGTDGVAFDDGYAFSSNGADGTITVVGETAPGKFENLATIPSQRSGRTIAADPIAHKLYLPVAEFGAAPEEKDGKKGRPAMLPDSFSVLVMSR